MRPGDWALVHAAAGGVGLILTQWLAAKGARVIGTVGDDAKAQAARAAGAEEVVVYTREAVAPRVRAITGGAGVRVTYDGVGRDTWEASLLDGAFPAAASPLLSVDTEHADAARASERPAPRSARRERADRGCMVLQGVQQGDHGAGTARSG